MKDYIESLSSSDSTPGGGNAVGVVNSIATGLMLMSLRIAILKKVGDIEEPLRFEKQLLDIQKKSLELADEDIEKFKEVMASWKIGGERIEKALKESAEVSLEISNQSLELIKLIGMQDIDSYTVILTDVAISLELAGACFRSGIINYKINVKGMKNQVAYNSLRKKRDELVEEFNDKYNDLIEKIKSLI